MENITLEVMTRELCHMFYKKFESDADTYMDMSKFAPYEYECEKVNKYFEDRQLDNRIIFAIMLVGKPVGEVTLKHIDKEEKECSLGIHLQNDLVKGLGIGTLAEKMVLDYAFNELKLETVNADVVQKNKRSQHVLEKVGFQFVKEDDMFKYYVCKR